MRYIPVIISIVFSLFITLAFADGELDVRLYNHNDLPEEGEQVNSVAFSFPTRIVNGQRVIDEDAIRQNPWLVADQYIYVQYGSFLETGWALRIITDNNADIGDVEPKYWMSDPDGEPATGDETIKASYGGLINRNFTRDPNMRAPLVWQVFRYNDPYKDRYKEEYRVPPGRLFPDPGPLNDNTTRGWFYDPWGYIADTNDTTYRDDETDEYFFAAWGFSNTICLLANHPVVRDGLPKPGGAGPMHELVIYIGANFALKNNNGETIGLLPAGNYMSRMYLQFVSDI